jgi:hypothetical protein
MSREDVGVAAIVLPDVQNWNRIEESLPALS